MMYPDVIPRVLTAPHKEVMKRARFAKDAGAGGIMVAPGIIGFDLMRELAADLPRGSVTEQLIRLVRLAESLRHHPRTEHMPPFHKQKGPS